MGETYPGALCSNEKQRIRYNYSNTERLSKNVIPSIKKIRNRMRYKIEYNLYNIEKMHTKTYI